MVLGPALLLAGAAPARAADFLTVRPMFDVALGMGASIDRGAPNPHPDLPIPSFFFSGGLGAGMWGLELRSFANGASTQQINRVSLELLGVVRPFAPLGRGNDAYPWRVLRTLAVQLGPAAEHVSFSVYEDWRDGAALGGHCDLPIGPPGEAKELRVRLGVRRMLGSTGTITMMHVGDSALELYAQAAFVF